MSGKKIIDLTDKKFGRWYVKSFSHRSNNCTYWNCVCECLNEKIINGGSLKKGTSTSCGCLNKQMKIKNLIGIKFGNLTVLEESLCKSKRKYYNKWRAHWLCKCDCGNTKIVSSLQLQSGSVKTCGCRKIK